MEGGGGREREGYNSLRGRLAAKDFAWAPKVKDNLSLLGNEKTELKKRLECLNDLADISKQTDITKLTTAPDCILTLRKCLVGYCTEIRAATLRLLRCFASNSIFLFEALNEQHLGYFIARSLEAPSADVIERVQALKLMNEIIKHNSTLFPRSCARAVIAIAEYKEDKFSRSCMDTLCELAIRNTKLVWQVEGLKVIIRAIVDPMWGDYQKGMVSTILYILDNQETRKYLRPNSDLRYLFSPLTENYSPDVKPEILRTKWMTCKQALCQMLKSWPGLIALASDTSCLKSIIDAFVQPYPELHKIIMDMFFELFQQDKKYDGPSDRFLLDLKLPSKTLPERQNLRNNYFAFLLGAFIKAGLMETLIEILREDGASSGVSTMGSISATPGSTGSNSGTFSEGGRTPSSDLPVSPIVVRAANLLGNLLNLANQLLPSATCARLQALPALVANAISFHSDVPPNIRSKCSSLVTNLHKQTQSIFTADDFRLSVLMSNAKRNNSQLNTQWKTWDKLDDARRKIDMSIETSKLHSRIQQTGVVTTKEYTKWDWDLMSDLFEGPLMNPKNLEIALKTKFIKRTLSFFRPERQFPSLHYNENNLKYVKVACLALEALAQDEQGVKFLTDHKLLKHLGEVMNDDEAYKSNTLPIGLKAASAFFSSDNMVRMMTREYFTLLGVLSGSPSGLNLLGQYRILDALHTISVLPNRSDLNLLILSSMNYNTVLPNGEAPTRAILKRCLESQQPSTRMLATRHLRALFRADVANFSEWGIEMLANQLVSMDAAVVIVAIDILDEACDDRACLLSFIKTCPASALSTTRQGKALLLRLLSLEEGYRYLSQEKSFLRTELELWKNSESEAYVQNLEDRLTDDFDNDRICPQIFVGIHLYGQLAQTAAGCAALAETNILPSLIQIFKDPPPETSKRKILSALWALGHICACTEGLKLLDMFKPHFSQHIIAHFVHLAEESPTLTIRGTCCCILGMISQTEQGCKILGENFNWHTPFLTVQGRANGVVVPLDIENTPVLQIKDGKVELRLQPRPTTGPYENESIQQQIVSNIEKTSFRITSDAAQVTLSELKMQQPEVFLETHVVYDMLKLLESYRFRCKVRKFLYSLTDGPIGDAFFALAKNNSKTPAPNF